MDVDEEEAEDSAAEFTGVFPVDWVGRVSGGEAPVFLAAMMLDCLRLIDSLMRTVFFISWLIDSVAMGDTIWRMAPLLVLLASFNEGGRRRDSDMFCDGGEREEYKPGAEKR